MFKACQVIIYYIHANMNSPVVTKTIHYISRYRKTSLAEYQWSAHYKRTLFSYILVEAIKASAC